MCCTITISLLCNRFEIWLRCFRIKIFKWIIFSNGFYSFRFPGSKSKFINYLYFVTWKEKTKLTFSMFQGDCYMPFPLRESALHYWKLKPNSYEKLYHVVRMGVSPFLKPPHRLFLLLHLFPQSSFSRITYE